jgi:hypothetical protein
MNRYRFDPDAGDKAWDRDKERDLEEWTRDCEERLERLKREEMKTRILENNNELLIGIIKGWLS